ncbi:probable thiopurine S-methyltransferase [Amphiura filiformis]|uniref:probable thiopurine S-methyltransferase n=1 Tax=Amphiura filiformis TaxID=82378 RepID=UPI003B214EBB
METTKSQDRAGDAAWQNRWENNRIGFHKDYHHPALVKYLDNLIAGRQNCRIFIPLCGKSWDMKWLADLGHTVVGVELCEIPVRDFFKEHNVEYDILPVEGLPEAKLYKSKDGKLNLYQCNLFKLSREILGTYDCVFDRGALIAVAKADRQRYVDLCVSLMKPECKYLVEIVDYNSSKMKGPPFDLQHDLFEQLYGNTCNLQVLEKDVDSLSDRMKDRGLDWLTASCYMLTLK